MEISQKLKKGSFEPVIPLLGIYPKEPKMLIQKNIIIPMFIGALFTITKIWKQPKCPSVSERIKQWWDIYKIECYLARKKKKILSFMTVWMDLENIMLSEISQSEKDKHHMIHSYVESNEHTELTSKIQTDSQMESRMTSRRG